MNRATILLLVGSGLLAAAALWWSITMSMTIDAPMSSSGWGAMIAGIVVTFVVGVVLMSLVFLSSRRGYDKPPDQIEKNKGSDSSEQPHRD
jgi:cation transporter-like permease